jgi:hypothetical protein
VYLVTGMAIIGFTGSRDGMTYRQKAAVRLTLAKLIDKLGPDAVALHGDCIGADAGFDALCVGLGIARTCRPSNLPFARAYTGARAVGEPKPPLVRNREIVDDSAVIIGAPSSYKEVLRSGTWATLRYARRVGRQIQIIAPDGSDYSW